MLKTCFPEATFTPPALWIPQSSVRLQINPNAFLGSMAQLPAEQSQSVAVQNPPGPRQISVYGLFRPVPELGALYGNYKYQARG